jgi:hypothetical protein
VGAIHSDITCKFGYRHLKIHVWDFRAQRCSPTRYTAPSWSADMSSSVSLFMTRIFASIGFASGPSRACQVSLVTTPLSGRLAVAYTWTQRPFWQQQRQERCERMHCSCMTHILDLQLTALDSRPITFQVCSKTSDTIKVCSKTSVLCSASCTELVSAHVAVWLV